MPTSLFAASATWTNANNNALWSDPVNWSNGLVPAFGDQLTFPAGHPGGASDITLPDGAAAWTITFNNSYHLTGGTLELHNTPGPSSGNSGSIVVPNINSNLVTIDTPLVGSATYLNLSAYLPGGLILNADNTFAAQVTPTGTGVRYNRDAVFGPVSNTVAFYANLVVDGTFSSSRFFAPGTSDAGFNVTAGNTFTILSGVKTGGVLTKTGPGTLVLTQPVQTDTPQFPTSLQATVNQGILRLTDPLALGNNTTGDLAKVQNTGILELANINFSHNIALYGTTLRGTGSAAASGKITINSSFPIFDAPTASDSLTLSNSSLPNFIYYPAATGQGRVILQGPATTAAGWTLNGGTLQLNHPQALGPLSSYSVQNGTLALSGITFTIPLTLSPSSGNPTLSSGDAAATTSGDVTLQAPNPTISLSAPGTTSHDLTISGKLTINTTNVRIWNPAGQPASLILTNPTNTSPFGGFGISVRPNATLTSAPNDKVSSALGPLGITLTGGTLKLLSNADTSYANIIRIGYVTAFDGPAPAASASTLHLDRYDADAVTFHTLRLPLIQLTSPNHTLKITSGHGYRLTLDRLSLSSNQTLDLTDVTTTITTETSSSFDSLISNIAAAYNHGAWDHAGLTSSRAALDPHHATALAYAVVGSELHLKYTWYGDANLDGYVDSADANAINPAGATWSQGDFNFDHQVTPDDYALFALASAYAGSSNISALVPEPAGIASGLAMLGALTRLSRWPGRRKR